MGRIALIFFLSLAAIIPSWSVNVEVPNEDPGKLKRVYSVTEVTVRILESSPDQL